MNSNTSRAKELLLHYFRLVAKKSGVGWDSDNDMEIGQIVDYIIAAAVDEARARKDEGDEFSESLEDYRYRKAQALALMKAERGE